MRGLEGAEVEVDEDIVADAWLNVKVLATAAEGVERRGVGGG